MSQDKVIIQDLVFDTIIGVLPHERTTPQPVRINIEAQVDISEAAGSKNLADTLDYAALATAIEDYAEAQACLLVETLADGIASLVLSYAGVESVLVDVSKPNALGNAAGVGVRIVRPKN